MSWSTPIRAPKRVRIGAVIAVLVLILSAIADCVMAQALQSPVSARSRPTIIVLDASGSMWKKTPNRGPLRGEVATAIVGGVTDRVEAISRESPARRLALGLVRFGYQYPWRDRRFTQFLCTDVELIRPPRTVDQVGLDAINRGAGVGLPMAEDGSGWNPKGYTPLTQALQEAGRAAPPEGADIVVITDFDEDVCAPDPCPLGSSTPAIRLPPQVKVRFVIASGLERDNEGRARHLAKCLNAEFVNPQTIAEAAGTGRDVADTLFNAGQAVLEFRFDREPRLPGDFKFGDLGLELIVSSDRADTFRVPVDDRQVILRDRLPGFYNARFQEPRGTGAPRFGFQVGGARPQPQIVSLAPAELTLSARGAGGQPPHGEVTWRVTDDRGRIVGVLPSSADVSVTLPPGRFKITAAFDGVETPPQEITLAFGGRGALTLSATGPPPQARRGTIVLVARDLTGHPVPTGVDFEVAPVVGGGPGGSPVSQGERLLVPGRYRVTPRVGAGSVRLPATEVQIAADRRITVAAVLPAPVIDVEVVGDAGQTITDPDTVFEIERLHPDGSAEAPVQWRAPRLVLAVQPGRHRVTAYAGRFVGHLDIDVPSTGRIAKRLPVAPAK